MERSGNSHRDKSKGRGSSPRDAERYMETWWHRHSPWEKRWTEAPEGEEESPAREMKRVGETEPLQGRAAET